MHGDGGHTLPFGPPGMSLAMRFVQSYKHLGGFLDASGALANGIIIRAISAKTARIKLGKSVLMHLNLEAEVKLNLARSIVFLGSATIRASGHSSPSPSSARCTKSGCTPLGPSQVV